MRRATVTHRRALRGGIGPRHLRVGEAHSCAGLIPTPKGSTRETASGRSFRRPGVLFLPCSAVLVHGARVGHLGVTTGIGCPSGTALEGSIASAASFYGRRLRAAALFRGLQGGQQCIGTGSNRGADVGHTAISGAVPRICSGNAAETSVHCRLQPTLEATSLNSDSETALNGRYPVDAGGARRGGTEDPLIGRDLARILGNSSRAPRGLQGGRTPGARSEPGDARVSDDSPPTLEATTSRLPGARIRLGARKLFFPKQERRPCYRAALHHLLRGDPMIPQAHDHRPDYPAEFDGDSCAGQEFARELGPEAERVRDLLTRLKDNPDIPAKSRREAGAHIDAAAGMLDSAAELLGG